MSRTLLPPTAEPCVWMGAGLITYKLCDRDFDCPHCPLDAALRGRALQSPPPALAFPGGESELPADRHYTRSHLWLAAVAGDPAIRRFGLDAFAAALAGRCQGVTFPPRGRHLTRGENACEIDLGLGVLRLAAPLPGTLHRVNPALSTDPSRAVTDPYGDGWLAELATVGEGDGEGFLSADEAAEVARLDARRFRRRVAHCLLAVDEVGPTMADGGYPVADLWHLLGPPRYLELLVELVH